jgi:hypothetical protein
MKRVESTPLCRCEHPEVDENLTDYVFHLCKNCGNAIRRKANICIYYLTCGYCGLAELNNYTVVCKTGGDIGQCKSGRTLTKEIHHGE